MMVYCCIEKWTFFIKCRHVSSSTLQEWQHVPAERCAHHMGAYRHAHIKTHCVFWSPSTPLWSLPNMLSFQWRCRKFSTLAFVWPVTNWETLWVVMRQPTLFHLPNTTRQKRMNSKINQLTKRKHKHDNQSVMAWQWNCVKWMCVAAISWHQVVIKPGFFTWWCVAWLCATHQSRENSTTWLYAYMRDVNVGLHACRPTWHHVMKAYKNVLVFFTWGCVA